MRLAAAEIDILLLNILPVAARRAAAHIVIVVAAAAALAMMAVDMVEVKRSAVEVLQAGCKVKTLVAGMDSLEVAQSRVVALGDMA